MAWRLARSLVVLRDEINTLAPHRNKDYDGTIGDESHQQRQSDHNPNSAGVVCAFDATHDPEHGADMAVISRQIQKSGHPALNYVIYNRKIWSVGRASEGWRYYDGTNPHDHHCHISVKQNHTLYDDTTSWGIASPAPSPEPTMAYKLTRPYMIGETVRKIQIALGIEADGIFGPATERAVRAYQEKQGLTVDGIVGPETLKKLGVTYGMG